ncbi:hypothetical protein EBN03_04185 [Nocardia stercoris]|uniref:Uncharacterized protein n=1 Tax=Nocardia stercoris TaxID=2483361 RepID=A0A3M2LFU3_9NOCA|nr:hypothetical protein EBN03_04185 [Nocardia stercoris]
MPVAVAAFVLSGCGSGDTPPLDDMAKCANIHFATTPKVIAQHRTVDFGTGRTASVVVDTTKDQLDSFEQLSAIGPLTPGVPSEWRSEQWMDAAVAESLKTDTGNTQFHDYHPTAPARWIVVHDQGGDQRRVYIKVYCEG